MNSKLSIGIPLLIFGVFWGFMTTIALIFSAGSEDAMPLIPLLIFYIVSIVLISIGITNIKQHLKEKNVRNNGTVTTGTFISMGSNLTVNNVKCFYIEFKYKNMEQVVTQKTGHNFTFAQANYLASLKEFKIKYLNNLAVVTENLDNLVIQNKGQNFNQNDNSEFNNCDCTTGHPVSISASLEKINDQTNKDTQYVYMCDYCGNLQEKLGKCKNCKAKIHPDSKRIKH